MPHFHYWLLYWYRLRVQVKMIGISNGKQYLADTNYILKDVSTFCHPKGGAQMCRKAKFVGSSLVVGKTDATHFWSNQKVSVS